MLLNGLKGAFALCVAVQFPYLGVKLLRKLKTGLSIYVGGYFRGLVCCGIQVYPMFTFTSEISRPSIPVHVTWGSKGLRELIVHVIVSQVYSVQ